MKTYYAKPQEVEREWVLIDAADQVLGRVAVKGMLPKNTLGRAMGKKLKVYTGAEHPHMAQQPREIKMEG